MPKGGAFSVIIPHRDRPAILHHSLERLIDLWDESIDDILVIDDGSSPHLVPLSKTLPRRTRVLSRPTSFGPCAARNLGLRECRQDLVLFFDDDAWPIEGELTIVEEAFADDPALAAIGFRILVSDRCESGGAFNVFVACGAAARRSALLSVGGFPEDYGFYVEESDLSFRLMDAGYRVETWTTPTVRHQKASEGRDPADMLQRLVINNRRWLEPHRTLPDVQTRLEELFEWHQTLGERLGRPEVVRSALTAPLACKDVPCWTSTFWEQASGLLDLRSVIARMSERGWKRVALWPIGKDVRRFARLLGEQGLDATHVIDPRQRYGVDEFAGLRARPSRAADDDVVLVASFSPGLGWNGLLEAGIDDGPVIAPFTFRDPRAPRDDRRGMIKQAGVTGRF